MDAWDIFQKRIDVNNEREVKHMGNIACYDSYGRLLKTLYQWDSDQTITIKGIETISSPVFHFCVKNGGVALPVVPEISDNSLIVKVPNIFLEQTEPIIAYLYQGTENLGFRTTHTIRIPIVPRPKPKPLDECTCGNDDDEYQVIRF